MLTIVLTVLLINSNTAGEGSRVGPTDTRTRGGTRLERLERRSSIYVFVR